MTREEQAKYYEKARQERQRHMQLYPHWNARDNYRYGQKKKKRKRDKTEDPGQNFASNFLTLSVVAVARPVPSGASKILRAGQSGQTGGDEQTKIIQQIYFSNNFKTQSILAHMCGAESPAPVPHLVRQG